MESCIYPFERFERLKKWKGYSLAYSFGYSFLCLFCSNKTGKYLFFIWYSSVFIIL